MLPSVSTWILPRDGRFEDRPMMDCSSVCARSGPIGRTSWMSLPSSVMYCGARRTPMLDAPTAPLVLIPAVPAAPVMPRPSVLVVGVVVVPRLRYIGLPNVVLRLLPARPTASGLE